MQEKGKSTGNRGAGLGGWPCKTFVVQIQSKLLEHPLKGPGALTN